MAANDHRSSVLRLSLHRPRRAGGRANGRCGWRWCWWSGSWSPGSPSAA